MNYYRLKNIAEKRINRPTDIVPQDALYIASQLNIRLKNSIECLEDFGEKYPLTHCNALYALRKGQPTIYYDEKQSFKNFFVAHEIAHHILGHISDGLDQHHDAQLMAAIIVAPSEYIHGIKSAQELTEKCKIPIDVAENYWYALEEAGEIEDSASKKRKFSALKISPNAIASIGIIAVLLAVIGFVGFQQMSLSHKIDNSIQSTLPVSDANITASPHPDALELDTVYVTPTGEKFHYKDCRHIQGADHVFEMTGYEAMQAGYEPCKDCIG